MLVLREILQWKFLRNPKCDKKYFPKNRTLIVGCSSSSKAYLTMKKLKNNFNSDIFNLTRSPEQYNDVIITEKKLRLKGEHESG